jgi:hypothetical protein
MSSEKRPATPAATRPAAARIAPASISVFIHFPRVRAQLAEIIARASPWSP